ncbi:MULTISPECIES: hypothetical protein [Pseudomonas]|uniref:hypothetical protein n=1 Tax=Pseudomonas TaxID=286 RepID=UPI00093BE0C6|nr:MULTISPECIES: hypothetical protein [Pseudomonas]OKO47011.1 hypothetical protein BMH52_17640 [Pseudomonas sp. BTN1]
MTALINLFRVVVLSLILIFTIYTYESQQALAKETAVMIMQSRQYTDNRIVESQNKFLETITQVSKATRLLALIICQRENDKSLCNDPLQTQGEIKQ